MLPHVCMFVCLFTVCLSVSVAEIGYREMSGLSVSLGIGKVARLQGCTSMSGHNVNCCVVQHLRGGADGNRQNCPDFVAQISFPRSVTMSRKIHK